MTDSQVPMTFLIQARQRYDTLNQTLVPVTKAIHDLEQDWAPRSAAFWKHVTTSLTLLQQAINACLALYHQEPSSQPEPVSTLIEVASIKQGCYLYYLRSRLEQVGIRLTAYQERASFAQKHLQQRQEVLHALRELDQAGQEALIKGKIWLDRVLHSQDASCIPSAKPTARKTTPTSRRRILTTNQASARPTLRLVSNQATGEDSSGTTRSR